MSEYVKDLVWANTDCPVPQVGDIVKVEAGPMVGEYKVAGYCSILFSYDRLGKKVGYYLGIRVEHRDGRDGLATLLPGEVMGVVS